MTLTLITCYFFHFLKNTYILHLLFFKNKNILCINNKENKSRWYVHCLCTWCTFLGLLGQ
jgi:hypothetical protein